MAARPQGQPMAALPQGQPMPDRPPEQPMAARPPGQPMTARPPGQPMPGRPLEQPMPARPPHGNKEFESKEESRRSQQSWQKHGNHSITLFSTRSNPKIACWPDPTSASNHLMPGDIFYTNKLATSVGPKQNALPTHVEHHDGRASEATFPTDDWMTARPPGQPMLVLRDSQWRLVLRDSRWSPSGTTDDGLSSGMGAAYNRHD
ncbi:hypothetical protein Tco_0745730 [Tanacetum coccineum]